MRFVYATRRSALALAQSRAFVATLAEAHPGLEIEEKQVVTSGDRIQDRPLSEVGGKGLFVKEIEEALLARGADFAVHSIKDVPAALPQSLYIACIPRREDPRDVLVSPRFGTLAGLPKGAKVGTSSLRRAVALRAARPDLTILPLRGNVDTRLRKLDAGEVDAILLAKAGLTRLGLAARATEVLEPAVCLPAVGQGALGIEARLPALTTIASKENALDTEVVRALRALSDEPTAICVAAERGVMLALEGDCKTPLGAHAVRDGDALALSAFVAEPDGSRYRHAADRTPWPSSDADAARFGQELGRRLASA